ncbi:PKD domain-containing protein [Halostella pelagica]|uniref:PKD domain-containing protein n=1 Tax=Halostella pelagica TaxID=2583824 RepID=UPI001080F682|nr:PKD domain-containing protein [Halostella pelagica]
MKETALALLMVSLLLTAPAHGMSAGNDPPLVDAGLDQDVSLGSTVLLDGTGSRDPDGEIVDYEWRIIDPDGTEISPGCSSCGRTEFSPTTVGNYTVYLSVTDDDGANSTDTLYVNVSAGDSPSIAVTGPTTGNVDSPLTYTADVRRGGAPLEKVLWQIDGRPVDTQSVSSDRDTVSLTRSFTSSGEHTVTAIVRDTEGKQSGANITTTVSRPTPNPPQDDPEETPTPPRDDPEETPPQDDPEEADESNTTTQPSADPVLRGDQLLTGNRPFRSEYAVDTNRPSSRIDHVRWVRDGKANGSSTNTDISWTPGSHTLSAVVTYEDGTKTRATFSDGTTDVYVDARPDVSFRQVNNDSTLSGVVDASDANGNLQQMVIDVNGTTVREWDNRDTLSPPRVYEKSFGFSDDEGSIGSQRNVTATAIDSRGQRVDVSTTGSQQAEPEIVRAEFVNSPVDSYHEQISADRYAAHHVIEVDLDGLSPGEVDIEYSPQNDSSSELDSREYHRHRDYDSQSDALVFHSYWVGETPGLYEVSFAMLITRNSTEQITNTETNVFKITPSKPEIRLDITHGGRFPHISDHGMVVDARESFDPDGSEIEFTWGQEAVPLNETGIGKFDSFKFANLTIEDGFGLQNKLEGGFLYHYTPDIQRVEEDTSGPYNSTDTIRFTVYSDRFHFTKTRFHEDHQVGVSATNGAHVIHLARNMTGEQEAKTDPDNSSGEQYAAIVEVDASVFSEDRPTPTVSFYNPVNPDTTEKTVRLTTTSQIFVSGQSQRANMRIQDISYAVNVPSRIERTVYSRDRRDELLEGEYRLDRSSQRGTEYIIEKRVQVQEPEYDLERETFQHQMIRDRFVEQNDGWKKAGTETQQETQVVTETEWRSSRYGNGEFTGNTRRVQVEPPSYQNEHKFEYQDETTRTRTITEEQTITVPTIGGGTREVTRTVTREETHTETVTRSYWSVYPRSPSHRSTGVTRSKRVSPAEYETQYEYQYQEEKPVTTFEYVATRQVQTQDAEFEWQVHDTTTNRFIVEEIAPSDNSLRVAGEQQATKWVLSRPGPSRKITVGDYDDPNRVVETSARVTGDVVMVSPQINGDEERRTKIREFTKTYTDDGLVTKDTIKEGLQTIEGVADPCLPRGNESGCDG